MDNIGKQLASVIIVFLGMVTMIFCFDSPDIITNMILVGSIVLSSVTILSVVCGTWIWGWDVSITPVFIVAGLLSGIIGYVLAKASVIRLFFATWCSSCDGKDVCDDCPDEKKCEDTACRSRAFMIADAHTLHLKEYRELPSVIFPF